MNGITKLINAAGSIDLKIDLKYKVGRLEHIHYRGISEDIDPELFKKIMEVVKADLEKQYREDINYFDN
jgi:hypothetical protein